ncbi:MAG: hypothetical protein QE267_09155 [Akkermansiaceae bacterium]|nr:hypothetical protein [Akkermansiaceae bacterium]
MAKSTPQRLSAGCASRLLFFMLLTACIGLGWAITSALQPQDLSDIGGHGPSNKVTQAPRDLKATLRSSIDRKYPLTLSETEINRWLAHTLATRQGGFLGEKITLDAVCVRLEDGVAEVIMERHFLSKPFTVSMFLQIERMEGLQGVTTEIQLHGGPYHPDFPKPPKGGRFGNLVVPQGFLILVMPAYEKLAALFSEEIDLAFREMSRIKIEKNQLVLDPRDPADSGMIPQTF